MQESQINSRDLLSNPAFADIDPDHLLPEITFHPGDLDVQSDKSDALPTLGFTADESAGEVSFTRTGGVFQIEGIEIDAGDHEIIVAAVLGAAALLHEQNKAMLSNPNLDNASVRCAWEILRETVAVDLVDEHNGDHGTLVSITAPDKHKFNPDVMESQREQVVRNFAYKRYQDIPPPSMETVDPIAIMPNFNPVNFRPEDVYLRMTQTEDGLKTHEGHGGDRLTMWRIVDRDSLMNGTGIISSTVMQQGKALGVSKAAKFTHMGGSNETSRAENPTPFLSFSTDPSILAGHIANYGFGTKDGRDSVVIRAEVEPDRVITNGNKKEDEVLLIGALSPDEYGEAYDVADFLKVMQS